MIRVGVDVGGTNTDAALIDGTRVVATIKQPTTADVTQGVIKAINAVLDAAGSPRIDAVMIGTTHFLNALVERRHLERVGVLRLCGPATRAYPPMIDWPEDLRAAVCGGVALVGGGVEVDGRPIAPLDEDAIAQTCADWCGQGIKSVAICGVFSTTDPTMERRAAQIVSTALPEAHISLSHEIGQTGLLPRESATILNACLASLGPQVIGGLEAALQELGLECPLYLTQNDGTLMSASFARDFPILALASGPTNSMRGASFLTGLTNAVVVDIGGTTTDVGVLSGGFPRVRGEGAIIAGVRTNFRVPDVLSVGLGGGSVIREVDGAVQVGPESVGYMITREALVFGGQTLTATDIAVAAGVASLGDGAQVAHLSTRLVRSARQHIENTLTVIVDRARPGPEPVDVILVGGGSILAGDHIEGARKVLRPDHFGAANAIGAAIAQISGAVDQVIPMAGQDRGRVIAEVTTAARARAIAAGAAEATLEVVEIHETPLAYLPGDVTKISVKVVGELTT